jgi:hypothetical protein
MRHVCDRECFSIVDSGWLEVDMINMLEHIIVVGAEDG